MIGLNDELEKFIRESSDIGYEIFTRETEINHDNLVISLAIIFNKHCKNEEEKDVLKTAIGVIIKDKIENDIKNDMIDSMSSDFEKMALEKAKAEGKIQ